VPRQRRFAPPGFAYHVVNRGNERRRIFFEDADYEWFLRLMMRGKQRYPVQIFGACPMPNHIHWVLQPDEEGALSAYVQWVLSRYACYVRQLTDTRGSGHVFQSRFWCEGIEDSEHFLRVLRYVEANPWRAKLVTRAEDWRWSSLALRDLAGAFDPLPLQLPEDWISIVSQPQSSHELSQLRRCGPLRPRVVRLVQSEAPQCPSNPLASEVETPVAPPGNPE
jgi:REP-associated tyrosine transposase